LKKPVSFDFRQINSQRSEKYLVSPYFLKQFDQKWYLIGKRNIKSKSEVERFPLTRIIADSLVIREDLGLIPNTIDPEDYFKDKFGVEDHGKKPETIILRIKKSLYERINDKPIHSSQYLLRNEQMFKELEERGLIKNKIFNIPSNNDLQKFHYLCLQVEININLEKLLLSYGPDMMVLYPFKLLKSQRDKIQNMLKNYQTWNKED
jgi:predicted DNA-binding transcriptional regulator YafY